MVTTFPTLVLIRGAGEHASGTAHRLFRCGFRVAMTEIAEPLAVRRTVAFAEAVFDGSAEVEGVTARLVTSVPEGYDWTTIPILVDPGCRCRQALRPDVLVDARLLKRGIDARLDVAPLVVGLGPGFRAGRDCHAVVETNRGHDLGRVITDGEAEPDTGVPGDVGGQTGARVFRAPADGLFSSSRRIGEVVRAGDEVGRVRGLPVRAALDGVLRGLLRPGLEVVAGTKLGDVDPRSNPARCHTLSDKTRAISGGVLEAILAWEAGRL